MILYHGTNIDIQLIDLVLCRPYKDFGKGFYTTDILEQAQKMAKRVATIYGGNPNNKGNPCECHGFRLKIAAL